MPKLTGAPDSGLVGAKPSSVADLPFGGWGYFPFFLLGIAVNFALMYSLGGSNWLRLGIWLVIGQAIYFTYGRHHSRLAQRSGKE